MLGLSLCLCPPFLFFFTLLLFPWLPDDPFDIQNCNRISSTCTFTISLFFIFWFLFISSVKFGTLVCFPTSFPYLLSFLLSVIPLLPFFFSYLQRMTARRSRQAGCHGNNKQVAAGHRAGEEREKERRDRFGLFEWTFKWVFDSERLRSQMGGSLRPPPSPPHLLTCQRSLRLRMSLRCSWMVLTDSWYVSR